MNKIFLITFFFMYSQAVFSEIKKACFSVEGMTCAACTITTKAAINKLDGIESIKVSFNEKKAEVQFNDTRTNSKEIIKKINSIGYKASLLVCSSK